MIIFENNSFMQRPDKPNEDWTGDALYVLDDNSELAQKFLKLFPNIDYVVEDGKLVDVITVEPKEPEPSVEDDIMGLLIDQEYRILMLELGLIE